MTIFAGEIFLHPPYSHGAFVPQSSTLMLFSRFFMVAGPVRKLSPPVKNREEILISAFDPGQFIKEGWTEIEKSYIGRQKDVCR